MAKISSGGQRFGSMMVIRDVTERQKLMEERMEIDLIIIENSLDSYLLDNNKRFV